MAKSSKKVEEVVKTLEERIMAEVDALGSEVLAADKKVRILKERLIAAAEAARDAFGEEKTDG